MANDITAHPLVVDTMAALKPHLEAGAARFERSARAGASRVKNAKPLKSISARYRHFVFHHLAKISTDFESLENVVAMVRRLPTRRTLAKWKFSTDRWLEYQYTLYLVILVGTVDRCLVLVNAVLHLGLAPRDCTESILLRHTRIAGTKIADRIRRILRENKSSREHRNLDVHRKELPPFHEIVGWEDYDWLPPYAFLDRVGQGLLDPDVLHRSFRYSGQLLARRMQKERTRLKREVWKLFDVLAPIAKAQAAAFDLFGKKPEA